jgi:hypothetical protein
MSNAVMTTRRKASIAIALILVYLHSTQYLYARAGGGHRSGWFWGHRHGDGGLITILVALIALPVTIFSYIVRKSIIKFRNSGSEKILKKAGEEDAIWNEPKMLEHTKKVFLKMQQAWMNRNLDDMKSEISDGLYEKYKVQLDAMKANFEMNMLDGISINTVKIIGIEDYKDDERDKYAALVEGRMTDYTINEYVGKVSKNTNIEEEPFADIYYFIRRGDVWILDEIINDPETGHIYSVANIKEEQL